MSCAEPEISREGKMVNLKNIEIRVLAELMKNSRSSDREIAKIVDVSQPTVTRIRNKLEKSGVIKEYTLIPDFDRIGYQIMAVVFLGKQEIAQDSRYREELRKAAAELERRTPQAALTIVDGMGIGKGRMLIFLCRDYAAYKTQLEIVRSLAHVEANELETFLVDLTDKSLFRIFSFRQVARHFEIYGESPKA